MALDRQQYAALEVAMRKEVRKLLTGMRRDLVAVARESVSPFRDRKGAGAFLRISPKSVDLFKRQGKLVPRYVGGKPLYPVEQLEKLLA